MNTIITVGRQFSSGGRELGQKIAEKLGYAYYDKEIITQIVEHTELSQEYVNQIVEGKALRYFPILAEQSLNINVDFRIRQMEEIVSAQTKIIKEMALKSNCVIIGRCADYILKEMADAGEIKLVRIFVYADMDYRVKRCLEREHEGENLKEKTLIKSIKHIDRERGAYYNDYTLQTWGDKDNYDIMLNTTNFDTDTLAECVAKSLA